MLMQLVDGIKTRRNRADSLGLALLYNTSNVLGEQLGYRENAAMSNRGIGAEKDWMSC